MFTLEYRRDFMPHDSINFIRFSLNLLREAIAGHKGAVIKWRESYELLARYETDPILRVTVKVVALAVEVPGEDPLDRLSDYLDAVDRAWTGGGVYSPVILARHTGLVE